MKKQASFILSLLISMNIGQASFREHQEFQVSDVKEQSTKLIGKVNKETWISLNIKDTALSVTVSMNDRNGYSVVFVTRYEGSEVINDNTGSRQTIEFNSIPNAKIVSRLTPKGIVQLEKTLKRTSGSFVSTSTTTYNQDQILMESIQKVSCSVVSKKEALKLIAAYFTHIDRKAVVWEDSN